MVRKKTTLSKAMPIPLDDGKYNAKIGGGKVIQITTGADGTVSSCYFVLSHRLQY